MVGEAVQQRSGETLRAEDLGPLVPECARRLLCGGRPARRPQGLVHSYPDGVELVITRHLLA